MVLRKPTVLLMGQTPPPWHGQAVATQILFDHDWKDFEIHLLRMEFSEEMHEVGRFQWRKLAHLWKLAREARTILKENPGTILFYPPSSAKWIPYLRDIIFLSMVRHLAGATVFIFHASGLADFVEKHSLLTPLGLRAYRNAEVALEVAQETIPPHVVFDSRQWSWCPCGIEVPEMARPERKKDAPSLLLFVGSLQEGKGVLEILNTASALKERGLGSTYRFRIVGKWFSEEFEVLAKKRCRELELSEMVEFAGQLTGGEKWAAYAEADIFFFPTHYESEASPIVIMEALGMGLPVISTRWAGIPAMLDGCASAKLLPVRSPEAFADAIIEYSDESGRPADINEQAKEFYLNNFLPARFIERVNNAFHFAEKILAEKALRTAGDTTQDPLVSEQTAMTVCVYLADQNPGFDRSFGISRMSGVIMKAFEMEETLDLQAVVSLTSQQAPASTAVVTTLPWGTRKRWIRLITDHLHPLFIRSKNEADIYYFPKGYLPLLSLYCQPSIITIHDTIIQYDEDKYPEWRSTWEYAYWAFILRHTIKEATHILTVSEASKKQIEEFSQRHGLPEKEITVTYEPCAYEVIPQPKEPRKADFVMHLASSEPHKRTVQLVHWWLEEAKSGNANLPLLHLIGTLPSEVVSLVETTETIVVRKFLTDEELQKTYSSALALILPSEIEGFGLPALEAYYLGTPVCFVKGTSVEEILGVATDRGGFSLESRTSLFQALEDVMAMPPAEIYAHGMVLRETYSVEKVIARITKTFLKVASGNTNRT